MSKNKNKIPAVIEKAPNLTVDAVEAVEAGVVAETAPEATVEQSTDVKEDTGLEDLVTHVEDEDEFPEQDTSGEEVVKDVKPDEKEEPALEVAPAADAVKASDETDLADTLKESISVAASKVKDAVAFVRKAGTNKEFKRGFKRKRPDFKEAQVFNTLGPDLPTDIYGVTTDLRKAMLAAASRIRGDQTKYSLVKETLSILSEYLDEKFVEDSKAVQGSLVFVREKAYSDIKQS